MDSSFGSIGMNNDNNSNNDISAYGAAVPIVAVGDDGEIFFDKSDGRYHYRINVGAGKYLDRNVSNVFDALVYKLGDDKKYEIVKGKDVSKHLYYGFIGNEKIRYQIPDGPVNEFIAKVKNGYSIESGVAGEIFLRPDGCYCFDSGLGKSSSKDALVVALDGDGNVSNEIFKDGMVKKRLYYKTAFLKKLVRIPDCTVIEFSKSVREFRKGVVDKFEVRQGVDGKIFLRSDGYYRFYKLCKDEGSKESFFFAASNKKGDISNETFIDHTVEKCLYYKPAFSKKLFRIPDDVVGEFSALEKFRKCVVDRKAEEYLYYRPGLSKKLFRIPDGIASEFNEAIKKFEELKKEVVELEELKEKELAAINCFANLSFGAADKFIEKENELRKCADSEFKIGQGTAGEAFLSLVVFEELEGSYLDCALECELNEFNVALDKFRKCAANKFKIGQGNASKIFFSDDKNSNSLLKKLKELGEKELMAKEYLYCDLYCGSRLLSDDEVNGFRTTLNEFRKYAADKSKTGQVEIGKICLSDDKDSSGGLFLVASGSLFVVSLDNNGKISDEIVENGKAKKDLFYRCCCSKVLYRIPKEVVSEFSKNENKLEIKQLQEGSTFEFDETDVFSLDCNGEVSDEIYEDDFNSKLKKHLFYINRNGSPKTLYRLTRCLSKNGKIHSINKINMNMNQHVGLLGMFNNMNNMNMNNINMINNNMINMNMNQHVGPLGMVNNINNSVNVINNNMINMNMSHHVGPLGMVNNINNSINLINANTMGTSNHISEIKERIPRSGFGYCNNFQK